MAGTADDNQKDIVKEAVRQFADARLQGEKPDTDEFVRKYPGLESQIRKGIQELLKINALFDSLVQADESDFDAKATGHDLTGQQIGAFEIVEIIGRGGMGVVYLARDTKLDRSVAIKSMPVELAGDSTSRMRFRREAKLLASLNHPNIAVIHEIIEQDEGAGFLVLEYVPGRTLAEQIGHKPLKLEEALSISRQIAEAVAAAHEKGVIHRDLKPGNIMITPEGRVKVLDFGLAKASAGEGGSGETNVTQAGRVIGTPAYMSPEQARGKPTDKRSDIWSFGCVMYEMLTGRVPFKGETVSDMLANILQTDPDWQTLPQATPATIQVLLRRCLEKEPRRRLRDIGDIAITLEDTTIELQHPTLRTGSIEAGQARPTKWSRRALPWLITGTAMAVLVLFAFIIGLKLGQPPDKKEGKAISLPIAKPINAIVVLPFENLSGDPEQEYFVDGMTDALSAELGKIKALRVISRTSAMRYKNTGKSVPEIVKELGVDAAIEGSVLKAGNDVRVTAQLVDGRTDAHLWSENYTGTLTNILALQSEVTLAIAREIEAALTPEEERRITRTEPVNPEAYEAYLLGRHYLDKSLEPDIDVAIEYFKRALEIDSTYAIAYAGLADAYTYFGFADIRSPEDTWPNARAAAEEALAIDEGLAEAHTSLATVKSWFEWDWPGAEREFKRALEINSNSVGAHLWYARFLSAMERHTEAIAQVERALELDPYSLYVNYFRAWALYYAGHKNEAIQLVENAIDADSDHPFWYWCLTSFYASQGMYEQALTPLKTQMDLMGDDINDELGFLGYLYGRLGRKAEALRQLEALDELAAKGRYVSPVNRSLVYIGLDDKDQAIAWLEKGYERRAGFWMVFLKAFFVFDSLRDDPRFGDLLQRMNFPEAPASGATAKPIEVPQGPIEKIAVLPFTSISNESGEEWFVDGMTDALITQLGKIKALTVISRTSAMQYKNISKPMREIAQDLGVNALVEGSVIRAGNDVQVTARLIDGRTDERIWGDFFQGTFSDILALQSEVTLAIAREIEAALTPEEERRITRTKSVNPAVHEAYLLGRHYLDKALEPDIEVAIEYFERALEIDSTYAIAYAGLADAYTFFGLANIRSPENTWPNARAMAEKALAIDEELAEAHTSLGRVKLFYEWDWPGAEREFRRALEINPNSVGAHSEYSGFLRSMERYDEALSLSERALELDPHSFQVEFNSAFALYSAGQKNEAIQLVENAMELDPDNPLWYWCLANFYAGQGMYEQALTPLKTQMDLMGDDINDELGLLGYLYGRLGRKAEALRQLDALDELAAKGRYVSPVNRSCVYIGLDEKDQAIAWLEKGYERHTGFWMLSLKKHSVFDSLRDDPRFADLLRRMNFPE